MTLDARESTAPRPMPGNTTELLHSATSISTCAPSLPQGPFTGSKGEPVATRALPSVHLRISSGTASWSLVGLDRGRMTGRSAPLAISLMTSSVKDLGTVDVPTRTLGWISLMTDTRDVSLPSHSDASLV